MKAVIVGCGRVGAALAATLDTAGHEVIILDTSAAAFDRLPATFGGTACAATGPASRLKTTKCSLRPVMLTVS